MKKRSKSIYKHLPPITLYLDDLEAVVSIVEELGANEIEIETEEHT